MQIKIPIELPDNFYDIVAENLIKKGDAVLVTRCENCKYLLGDCCYHPKNTTAYRVPDFGEHYVYKNGIEVDPNHFCSYAEPKESEDKNK